MKQKNNTDHLVCAVLYKASQFPNFVFYGNDKLVEVFTNASVKYPSLFYPFVKHKVYGDMSILQHIMYSLLIGGLIEFSRPYEPQFSVSKSLSGKYGRSIYGRFTLLEDKKAIDEVAIDLIYKFNPEITVDTSEYLRLKELLRVCKEDLNPGTIYHHDDNYDDEDIGTHACCSNPSYMEHTPDCAFSQIESIVSSFK